jgi:hypothetical protein
MSDEREMVEVDDILVQADLIDSLASVDDRDYCADYMLSVATETSNNYRKLCAALLAERERVAALEAAAQKALQALRRNQAAGLRIGDAILRLSSVLESGHE